MKILLSLVACILACNFLLVSSAAVVTSLAADEELPYPISTAVFLGEVNGVPYNISGTASSVLAELQKQHPDVDFDARAATNENSTAAARLEKRNKIWNPSCFYRGYMYRTTEKKWFEQIIRVGRIAGGTVFVRAKSCALINCRLDARIYVCNRQDYHMRPSLPYLVSYAEDICNFGPCGHYSVLNYSWQCGGEMYDSDNYSVVARRRGDDEDKCYW